MNAKVSELVLEFMTKQRDYYQTALAEIGVKRDKAIAEHTFHYWTEWYLIPYIKAEIALNKWNEMLHVLSEKKFEDDDKILVWLNGVREYYFGFILEDFGISTSKGANLVKELRREVLCGIVGRNILDSGSLIDLKFRVEKLIKEGVVK
jgi:hypothetical protein